MHVLQDFWIKLNAFYLDILVLCIFVLQCAIFSGWFYLEFRKYEMATKDFFSLNLFIYFYFLVTFKN